MKVFLVRFGRSPRENRHEIDVTPGARMRRRLRAVGVMLILLAATPLILLAGAVSLAFVAGLCAVALLLAKVTLWPLRGRSLLQDRWREGKCN